MPWVVVATASRPRAEENKYSHTVVVTVHNRISQRIRNLGSLKDTGKNLPLTKDAK